CNSFTTRLAIALAVVERHLDRSLARRMRHGESPLVAEAMRLDGPALLVDEIAEPRSISKNRSPRSSGLHWYRAADILFFCSHAYTAVQREAPRSTANRCNFPGTPLRDLVPRS